MDTTEYSAAFNHGLQAAEQRFVAGSNTPFVVLPEGARLAGLEELMLTPARKKGSARFDDAVSFIRYVTKHKSPSCSALFANVTEVGPNMGASVEAVLNHHGEVDPGWGDHRARFVTQRTVEWQRWLGADRKPMPQAAFAEFLEDNVEQVVAPSGADLVELARRLEAVTTAKFTQGVRLANGNAELRYEETTEAKAGEKGTVAVPERFAIGLALFNGGARYRVEARMKYRIKEGVLVMWYELENPHVTCRAALDETLKQIGEDTELPVYFGQLEK